MSVENTSWYTDLIAPFVALGGTVFAIMKIKGKQDEKIANQKEKIENVEDDLLEHKREIEKNLDDYKEDVKEEFDTQGKRIDNRVHVNDLVAHKELIETKFLFICESLAELKEHSKRKRASDPE